MIIINKHKKNQSLLHCILHSMHLPVAQQYPVFSPRIVLTIFVSLTLFTKKKLSKSTVVRARTRYVMNKSHHQNHNYQNHHQLYSNHQLILQQYQLQQPHQYLYHQLRRKVMHFFSSNGQTYSNYEQLNIN